MNGIGGRIGLPAPRCSPFRIALINISSSQLPIPVPSSGIKLAEKEIPQGPTQAVNSEFVKYHSEFKVALSMLVRLSPLWSFSFYFLMSMPAERKTGKQKI